MPPLHKMHNLLCVHFLDTSISRLYKSPLLRPNLARRGRGRLADPHRFARLIHPDVLPAIIDHHGSTTQAPGLYEDAVRFQL